MKGVVHLIRSRMAVRISLIIGLLMLIVMGSMGYWIARQQLAEHKGAMDEFLLAKARLAANVGAKMYGSIIEDAINTNLITVADAFDKEYKIIAGYDWGKQPKYHTRYDSVLDTLVLSLEDSIIADPDFIYAVGQDVNGYLPVHNTRFQKPLTGDPTKDLSLNRSKRFFDDKTGQGVSKNQEAGFLQTYNRDTGELLWDVSSPIYVKGQHWGGFRIGVQMARVKEHSNAMLRSLILGAGGLFALTIIALMVQLSRSLKAVRSLTSAADAISVGEHLDEPLQSERVDGIGQLSKSVDRLRISMKEAMARLDAE